MRTWVGLLLLAHGLITVGISAGSFAGGEGVPNPAWLSWWPRALGQSWLPARFGVLGGLLWLAGGLLLIAAGLGLFGIVIPATWWRGLAIGGAAISLVALLLYAHPYYLLGIALNVGILVALLWAKWPSMQAMGA